MNDNKKLWTKN